MLLITIEENLIMLPTPLHYLYLFSRIFIWFIFGTKGLWSFLVTLPFNSAAGFVRKDQLNTSVWCLFFGFLRASQSNRYSSPSVFSARQLMALESVGAANTTAYFFILSRLKTANATLSLAALSHSTGVCS